MSTPRKIRCLVDQVTNHGDHVYSVELKPERPLPVFHPGQFLHLALDEYDPSGFWPESRVFSIASSPVERNKLTVIYSVKGQYTSRMEKELRIGMTVWVKLPYGEFVVDGKEDVVLIAGGTGITAFQAFISELPSDHPNKVVLLYGARRPELLLGRDHIEAKSNQVTTFSAFLFSEEMPLHSSQTTLSGRIDLEVIRSVPLSKSAVYYLAGPPSMVAAISNILAQQGVSANNIRVDAWE
jgi:ferredoxin-NADP reductase